MNRILLGINALLLIAVAFLFYKVFESPVSSEDKKTDTVAEPAKAEPEKVVQAATAPTGKIAYVNIDRLNEESLEIADLVAETKRRKNAIEASVESLSLQYEKKVQEFARQNRTDRVAVDGVTKRLQRAGQVTQRFVPSRSTKLETTAGPFTPPREKTARRGSW